MHKYICLDCEKEIEVKNKPKFALNPIILLLISKDFT
mgnify:CR=1 FL=1